MKLRTAKQLLDEEIRAYRKKLQTNLTSRGELRRDGFDTNEIDEIVQEEKEAMERELAQYLERETARLPERETELAERRERTFASLVFVRIWLPQCLAPVSCDLTTTLTTREVYDSYLAWCKEVNVTVPYSLAKVRSAIKEHYQIDNIRTGLRAYGLVSVSTDVNKEMMVAQHEADERKWEADKRKQHREREREARRNMKILEQKVRTYRAIARDSYPNRSELRKMGYDRDTIEYAVQEQEDAIFHEVEQRRSTLIRQWVKEGITLPESEPWILCEYCKRRTFNAAKWDKCYWCARIKKEGLDNVLHEYLAESDWRTGASMRLAYQRMVRAGEIVNG